MSLMMQEEKQGAGFCGILQAGWLFEKTKRESISCKISGMR